MTGLAEWLTTQVDADEAAARAAWPGPWELRTETGGFGPVAWVMMPIPQHEGAGTGLTSYVPLGSQDAATAGHIALHDPVRALAEVAFKRAILAAHRAEQPFPDEGPQCSRCTGTGLLGIIHSPRWPCPDIWAMAQVYKDRPGYAEATS